MNLLALVHLCSNDDFVFSAFIVIDGFLYDIPEERLALLPLLFLDIEFVLKGLRIDDIGKDREFFVHVQVFEGVHYNLPIFVHQHDINMLVLVINFLGVTEQDGHSPTFSLKF